MRYVSCTLLKKTLEANSIGVQKETISRREVPIMKIEDIFADEFYQANEQGFKPTLRLRISDLNYNGESELEYGDKTYTIIRTQNPVADELILICEEKAKNVR